MAVISRFWPLFCHQLGTTQLRGGCCNWPCCNGLDFRGRLHYREMVFGYEGGGRWKRY